MKETIFKIFDTFTEGVDTYYYNGSMWLIFTDEQRWVIELAQDGILWYNSYFFGDCFKYVSLDVVENQHYITEWVETIIQNGVKDTMAQLFAPFISVENTIQNGVKGTSPISYNASGKVGYITQNGVKYTKCDIANEKQSVEDTIQNGVKFTKRVDYTKSGMVEDIVQNGVKETISLGPSEVTEKEIKRVIKETHEDVYQSNARVWGVVNNGIKQTIELPDMSGQLISYGKYYARQKDKTYPHDNIVSDVINGK
jgi:hypothetical protein